MEDDSTAPNVRLRGVNARYVLRRHVLRRPHDDAALHSYSFLEGGSQPKVYQFDLHILPAISFHWHTHDILQLQIAVQHHLSMQVLQRRKHLMHDLLGQSFGVAVRGFMEVVPKRPAFAVFRDDVVGGVFADGFVHLDDVGVVEAGKGGHFVEEELALEGCAIFEGQDFHCPQLARGFASCLVDDPETALADHLQQLVFLCHFRPLHSQNLLRADSQRAEARQTIFFSFFAGQRRLARQRYFCFYDFILDFSQLSLLKESLIGTVVGHWHPDALFRIVRAFQVSAAVLFAIFAILRGLFENFLMEHFYQWIFGLFVDGGQIVFPQLFFKLRTLE